jgi:hypothetical protein
MKKLLISLAAVAAISTPAFAANDNPMFYSAKDLREYCNSGKDGTFCLAYIFGVADADQTNRACVPMTTTGIQVATSVKVYLNHHDELMDFTAASVVGRAMFETYCGNG